ncbi:tyrosine-protein phosphatase non-receptor type 2 isoform X5 [Sceloporus undulatus]|uniref:tyrosine-protein phosphatase non-receptor type 2 isoform X5 n=1 Tax=Sceloporus undulatus TaxID=8520 RepID=UPI001C4AB79B|nr:tyrosine-protein phosphatase non-receptor type 2 isoform X5 [Sceloporus undulatus]
MSVSPSSPPLCPSPSSKSSRRSTLLTTGSPGTWIYGTNPMTTHIKLQNMQKIEIVTDTGMLAHVNDHSRVKLQNTDNDYINASLVVNEEARRNYILTQGPLPNTCCHFWLMVWQQKTKAVVMLNRIVEKDSTGESRMIFHFHYTTWPDFGVPESPASFLNFLFKVRESGSLNPEQGPAVIHCSAGIGRSGTFSLVDTCLVLMEKREDPFSVDIKQVLLNMRKYRMGLIQTPDQLRFSYMAVIEGTKYIMGDPTIQNRWKILSKEDQAPSSGHSPPQATKVTAEKYNGNSVGLDNQEQAENVNADLSSALQNNADANADIAVRKRLREDRKANTAQMVQQMKHRLSEAERKRKRWLYWKPVVTKIGFGSAIFIAVYSCCQLYFHGSLFCSEAKTAELLSLPVLNL